MLRIAVPNKGSLSDAARETLSEAGYRQRRESKELVLVDPENSVEFFYLRPRDIAIYVAKGTLDAGLTGRDLFLDAQVGDAAEEVMGLGFARSTFRFAAPAGTFTSVKELAGKRIATSYDGLLSDFMKSSDIQPERIVHLDGAVESSVSLGVADAIADVVETGSTLKAAGMDILGEPILHSEAILIGQTGQHPAALDKLIQRVRGVLVAREYVMVDYDVPKVHMDAALKVTPGLESPTIASLADENWVAVRSMAKKKDMNRIMDELYEMGAKAILASAIHAIRI